MSNNAEYILMKAAADQEWYGPFDEAEADEIWDNLCHTIRVGSIVRVRGPKITELIVTNISEQE